MREPTYRQALFNAWKIVWRHPPLWIFGLLSIFLGQWGLGDFLGQFNLVMNNNLAWPPHFWVFFTKTVDIINFNYFGWLLLGWVGLIFLLIGLVIIFVTIVSRGALIFSAATDYKSRKASLAVAWHAGVKSFWTVLFLNIIGKLSQAVLILFLSYLFLSLYWSGSALAYFGLALSCAFVLFLSLLLESILIYSSNYAVIDGDKFGKAVGRGYELFASHVLVSLELGLILLLVNCLLMVLLVTGSFFIFLPSLLLIFIAGFSGLQILIFIATILGVILGIIFVVLLGSFFNAFTTSAWTYLFMKMHHEGVVSHLTHYFSKFFRRA